MLVDITRLDHPIDVMVLIHKAFHALSLRVEDLAAESQEGGRPEGFRGCLWLLGQAVAVSCGDGGQVYDGPARGQSTGKGQ